MARGDRVRRLRALLDAGGLSALFITSLPNIRYLTGFTGSAAACLIAAGRRVLFTDSRYRLQARIETGGGWRVEMAPPADLPEALATHVAACRIRDLGFEADSLSWSAHRRLRRALPRGCRLRPAPRPVERLRMIKSAEEIRALERLARMTDAALAACRSEIRAGMTEREVAEQLERCCREAGGEEAAFRPIVASGPRAAMPHYRAASGRVRKGSCLLIDFGIQSGGYNSDLTRTFYWGRVTARFRAVYGAVAEAQQFALQIIKPGIRASAVDAGTRALIASRGFGSRFGHALGHGIGMEVHEAPRIGRESSDILEAGMVFSVEPGIYLPGWGGVRIEDMVLVTPGGCRTLTSFAKELGEIVL